MTEWGALSLVPPVLTLGLALWTRNILLALSVGALSGTLVISGGNPFSAVLSLVEDHMFVQVADPFNAQIIFVMMAIGGFIHLLQLSGGASAFASHMVGSVTSGIRAQLSAWLAGIGIFFSDVGNPLIIGPLFRPIFDGLNICREKLAYVLDCTSSPVCILIPFIGWGAYISGLIEKGYASVGLKTDSYQILVLAIPFQFYALLTLIAVPVFAFRNSDFGAMRKAQEAFANRKPNLHSTNAEKYADEKLSINTDAQPAILFILPIGTLLGLIGGLLSWYTYVGDLTSVHVRSSLLIAYVAAATASAWMLWRHQRIGLTRSMQEFVKGAQDMVFVATLLVLAWSLGAIINELGTGPYLAQLVDGALPPFLVPAIAFLLAAATSFATGSSWGTFAILMVIALPVAHALEGSMLLTVAAVLSGGLFGDHTSPISDTTVLAAMGAECDHVNHVVSQLPYALMVGGISAVAYVVAGLYETYWVLGGAMVLLGLAIWLATPALSKIEPVNAVQ